MKKWHYFIIAAMFILIITNPRVKAFKDYLDVNTYSGLRRTSNFSFLAFINLMNIILQWRGIFFTLKSQNRHLI